MELMDKRHEGSEPDWHLVAMVATSERGSERVSMERLGGAT